MDIDVRPERVRLFPRDRKGQRYIERIKGSVVDPLFIGLVYERGEDLAHLIKKMKLEAQFNKSFSLADSLAKAFWVVLQDDLLSWAEKLGTPALLVPVPSRWGTSERLARGLCEMLNTRTGQIAILGDGLLRRTTQSFEMKDIDDWKEREKKAAKLFVVVNPPQFKQGVLLVDDVVSSGASLRACARLLQSKGMEQVGAAVLSGSPDDAPPEWYSDIR